MFLSELVILPKLRLELLKNRIVTSSFIETSNSSLILQNQILSSCVLLRKAIWVKSSFLFLHPCQCKINAGTQITSPFSNMTVFSISISVLIMFSGSIIILLAKTTMPFPSVAINTWSDACMWGLVLQPFLNVTWYISCSFESLLSNTFLIMKSPVNLSFYFSFGSSFIDMNLFFCIVFRCDIHL